MVSRQELLPGAAGVAENQELCVQPTECPDKLGWSVRARQELPVTKQVATEVFGPLNARSFSQQRFPGGRGPVERHGTVRLTGLVAPTHTWSGATSVRGSEIVATAGHLKRDPVERSGGEAGLRCQGGAEAPDVRGDQITKSAACLGILWNSRGRYGLDIERSQGGVVYVFQCAPSPQQRAFRTGAISVK